MSDWKSRISLGFLLLVTIGSIGSYWVVDRVTNSQAPTTGFGGWISILEPQAEFAGKDRIWFQLWAAQPGDLNENPSVIINIVVCGDSAFHGAVLLGGDAQLSKPEIAVARLTAPGLTFNWKTTASHTGHGSFLPAYDPASSTVEAQVIPFAVTPIAKCLSPAAIGDNASGTPVMLRGRLRAPITRRSGYGPWQGPRYQTAWPSIGWLPGVAPNQLGEFSNPPGLQGSWFRPRNASYQVHAGGIGPRLQVDLSRPSSETGTDLTWRSSEPIAPLARYVDTESLVAWQGRLVIFGIIFGIGGSITATLITDTIRKWQRSEIESFGSVTKTPRSVNKNRTPQHSTSRHSYALLATAGTIILFALWRRRRRS